MQLVRSTATRRRAKLSLLMGAVVASSFGISVQAKVRFASPDEMISKAKIIAVVEARQVESTKARGEIETYTQRAIIKPIETLKGVLTGSQYLYGSEDVRNHCGYTKLSQGKCIVFLTKDKDLLVGSNYQFSICPLESGMVQWYATNAPATKADFGTAFSYGAFLHPLQLPLANVIKQIKQQVAEDAQIEQWPIYLRQFLSAPALDVGVSRKMPNNNGLDTWLDYKNGRDAFATASRGRSSIKKELLIIFKRGHGAGRIYAAVLTKNFDPHLGNKMLTELQSDQSPISIREFESFQANETTVAEVCKSILKTGKYRGFPS